MKRILTATLVGLALTMGSASAADAAPKQAFVKSKTVKAKTSKPLAFKRMPTVPACKVKAKAPKNRVGSKCHFRMADPHDRRRTVLAIVTYTKRGTHLVTIKGEADREIRWVKGKAVDLI